MRLDNTEYLDFSNVLIRPKRSSLSSRNDVSLEREFPMIHSGNVWKGVPIIAANMDTVGTMSMAKQLNKYKCSVAFHKFMEQSEYVSHYYNNPGSNNFYSLGATPSDLQKFIGIYHQLLKNELVNMCVDVANGYTQMFVDFIKRLRDNYPKLTIMAGNVATGDMTEALIFAGADIVKVGIGSGAACLTRRVTGVGVPQLSAIVECADAAHGLKGLVCSDGGCVTSGDVAKAFGAGADFVMLGSILAGHAECEGEITNQLYKLRDDVIVESIVEEEPGTHGRGSWFVNSFHIPSTGSKHEYSSRESYKQFKSIELAKTFLKIPDEFFEYVPTDKSTMKFYGMSSNTAQKKHYGEKKVYRASEGRTIEIPYRGSVTDTLEEILGGIRSCMTYVGATKLKELSKRTTFIRVSSQINNSLEAFSKGN